MKIIALDFIVYNGECYIRPCMDCSYHVKAGALNFHIDLLERLGKCVFRAMHAFVSRYGTSYVSANVLVHQTVFCHLDHFIILSLASSN